MIKDKIFFTEKAGKYILPVPRNGFTLNDPNSEFTDSFFVEWSYPVEDPFTDDLKLMFGDLENPNNMANKKSDEGFLNIEGEVYPAVLNFISCKNGILKYQFEFGYENLPVFDRKISEFDLEKFTPANMYDFVDGVLPQKWPETNVCFPLVYTDRFQEKSDDPSFLVKNCYNEAVSNLILRNEINAAGFQNRSILKPFVYLQYVLQQGFQEAGFTLKGDILTDPDFLYAALDHENEFYETISQVVHKLSARVYYPTMHGGLYTKKFAKFNCFGTYTMSLITTKQWLQYLYFKAEWKDAAGNPQFHLLTFNEAAGQPFNHPVELIYTLPPFLQDTEVLLSIEAQAAVPYSGDYDHNFSGYLNPPNPGSNSEYYPPLRELDLKKAVPDITFRQLLSTIKKWKNFKLTPKGGEMWMDLVTDSIADVKDISFVDQKDVEIRFNKRKNYILKFGAPEEYGYEDYKYDAAGLLEQKLNMEELDSEVISIGGYPLPQLDGAAGISAKEITDSVSGVVLVRYEGLSGGRNRTIAMDNLLIPSIYNTRYKLWIRNRLEAAFFLWTFSTTHPTAKELKSHHKIGAYNNIHKVVNIIKKFVGEDMYQLEIETENRF